jgi:hypothetical protein
MRNVSRALILLLMLVALPLRGYAAVAAELCAMHDGGAQAAQAAEHDHDSAHEQGGQNGDHPSTASVCSHCAACSVGASLAPDSARPVAVFHASAGRIPFFGACTSGHVPQRLDRPPLAL